VEEKFDDENLSRGKCFQEHWVLVRAFRQRRGTEDDECCKKEAKSGASVSLTRVDDATRRDVT